MNSAGVILVVGIVAPAWCWFVGAFGHRPLLWVVGILLAVASIVIVVLLGRRLSPIPRRVLTSVAVVVALISGGANAVLLGSALPDPQPIAEPEQTWPDCGPDSRPAVFGGDTRYTPCPQDVAIAEALLAERLPLLPVTDVTPESVAAAVPDAKVGMITDTVLGVVWVPMPATCGIATWDGATWTTEVVGGYVDGGCLTFRAQ